MNTFGTKLRLTSFGESHSAAMGGVIDGLPAGLEISLAEVSRQLARRRPGYSAVTSPRREADEVEYLSGLMTRDAYGVLRPLGPGADRVVTLGTPVGFVIRNTSHRSVDYEAMREIYRPSHADYTWERRFGGVRDWRGGGRASGRETVCRVVAGSFARQPLEAAGVTIRAALAEVGGCADKERFEEIITAAASDHDSVGGVVECRVSGFPAGVGTPVFGKAQQALAAAMLSIGGAKGFEYGDGFAIASMRGSQGADGMRRGVDGPVFTSNHSGGIQGGITNGEDIVMRVAFKPTPTVGVPLETIDRSGAEITTGFSGRHDPCIAVRAVPVVEAMAALTLYDLLLASRP